MLADWHFYALALPAVILLGLAKGGFAGMGALSLPMLALVTDPVRAAAIMLPLIMLPKSRIASATVLVTSPRILKGSINGLGRR